MNCDKFTAKILAVHISPIGYRLIHAIIEQKKQMLNKKKSNRGCIILGYNNNNEFCKHITSLKLIPLNIVSDIFFNLTDFEI